jgi:hypothetical protein
MPFPVLGSNSAVAAGYEIDNSLRFNQEDDARLSRTPSSAGNRQKFTLSTWIKFCNFNDSSGSQNIFESRPGNLFLIVLTNTLNATGGNTIRVEATGGMDLGIDRFFRDGSAWYHLVFAFDTTQATASNRVKFYVNGEQTGLNSTYTTYPNQNDSFEWNNTSIQNVGGSAFSGDENSDFYLADTYNIDGQQLAPTEFGETNDNGVWIPKRFSGSYGTNGFKLEFQDSGNLGDDTSGNGNDFTATNLTATDQTTDTPTNNFCTLNPLNITASVNLSEGNTQHTNTVNDQGSAATMGFANGKWYWEVKCINKAEVGINLDSDILQLSNDATINANDSNIKLTALVTNSAGGANDLRFNGGTETVNSSSVADNDIIMVAVDADNTKIYFGVNGTWMNSGDPASGTGELKNFSSGYTTGNFITPAFTIGVGATASFQTNFGNAPFSISSGNSDANGYGNFEYAVPSGFYSLCTKNLAEYG